jgi:hypothetical protein
MTEMPARIVSPEQMRQAVADYVTAVHRAYLGATAGLAPEVAEALPLRAAGEFSVLAVGAGSLHLIATARALPAIRAALGPAEAASVRVVEAAGELGPLRWRLRFYDPVVVPELASLAGAAVADPCDEVRRTLGVESWLYHLVASPSAGLSPHNALHAGIALGHGHARDVLAAQDRP